MKPYSPPFKLTHNMMRLVASISGSIGKWTAVNHGLLVPKLRRENRIRTIQASLAVEQNTLTFEQVTAVVDGKHVLGTPKEIQEVQNAFVAYEAMEHFEPANIDDLLSAHKLLLHGLIPDAGNWRSGGAGIYRGDQLVHMAPPANQVPRLIAQLTQWLATSEAHPLIASSAFHYEFEFIHPFSDGNGRMGRLWQTLILSQWQPILAYLPVETVIKAKQDEYYKAFRHADATSDCSLFIEFLLDAINTALDEAISSSVITQVQTQVQVRVKTPEQILQLLRLNPELSLSDIANHLGKALSTIERAVVKLKQQNKLIFEGAKKDGRWKVLE